MNFTDILSPGEKIRKIRKEFKIRQHEITGGEITRNLISIIENDKANLTQGVAEILSENINKVCADKGMDFRITTEYLLETKESQANRIADSYIEYLGNSDVVNRENFEDKVREIEAFLSVYDIFEKKVTIFERLGYIFKSERDYYKAYTYYIKAYENSSRIFKDIRLFKLLLNTGFCCLRLKKYKETLDFNRLALLYNGNIPEDIHYKILLNNVLAYKNLNDYEKALAEIQRIENIFNKDIDKFDILTLKANCLKLKKFYKDSLQIHEQLLNNINEEDIEKKMIALCNILEIYIELNDTKNIKKYIDRCSLLMNAYDKIRKRIYSPEIYNDIALGYKIIGTLDLAKSYFAKAITAGREYNNVDVILSSFNNLFSIYVEENNTLGLEDLRNQLIELMMLKLLTNNNTIILRFIYYYNENFDRESIESLIGFVLKEEMPLTKFNKVDPCQ